VTNICCPTIYDADTWHKIKTIKLKDYLKAFATSKGFF